MVRDLPITLKGDVRDLAPINQHLININLLQLLSSCYATSNQLSQTLFPFVFLTYMPNKSLNFYLFGMSSSFAFNFLFYIQRCILDWRKCVQLIEGIIQGLLYLQEYSNFTIIHQDLKGSNISLDKDMMNPKISDFRMAKLFGKDEHEAKTDRIVGTYSYVPLEYVRKGIYSMKYDVCSFGRDACYYGMNETLNLNFLNTCGQGEGMEFMDPSLDDSSSPCKLVRCLQLALLSVQENSVDRPTMSEVYSMLKNENGPIATPQKLAFSIKTDEKEENKSKLKPENCSINDTTISEMVAR
ncbi:hypothetical protein I3842_15G160500 [Carya illinoinensis]|uniref:non-specific serine/threonine protein kinase n=1 Tax=Carya illinoinensis TaxID=32201 RepID=A0A922AH15_CARIL|nr:hypothetical protein I3842_15G160500 [Carya illinoinensis]